MYICMHNTHSYMSTSIDMKKTAECEITDQNLIHPALTKYGYLDNTHIYRVANSVEYTLGVL